MRFLETFFRHRIVAILPVVLGLAVAAGYVLVQPRQYTSTASLWVDLTVPGNAAASAAEQYEDPSTYLQSQIQELLATRSFALAVGQSGGLISYLQDHPQSGASGLAAIPGLGALSSSGSAGSVDDRVAADLPNMVSVVTAGPQVLNLVVSGPSPQLAAAVARALIREFTSQVVTAAQSDDQTSVSYYGQQVAQAQLSLQQAQQQLTEYLAAHPKVPADGTGDATATELYEAVQIDQTSYQSLLSQYQQAQLDLANAKSQSGFEVMDAPAAGGTAVSITKKLVEAGAAGLLIGLLVSALIVTGLTWADRTARDAADVRRVLGLEVAASIEQIPGGTVTSTPAGET
ncbi:MAG: hypothetical protein ABSC16_09910 [Candidatus Dormibacteria bacterium]|jgi:uncharacterized protein involved in exopolysaccharide biosynthesis